MIDRYGMWQMLFKVYGVGNKLLKSVQNIYVDSIIIIVLLIFV